MSDAHEKFLATLIGGERQRNSGAVWSRQMDARNTIDDGEFRYAVDGKSTFSESIKIDRAMWEKAKMQAHGEIPALALRWYNDYRLTPGLDLIVLDVQDFKALLDAARGQES